MASRLKVVTSDVRPTQTSPAKIADSLDGSGRDLLVSMRSALARMLDAGEISSNAIASAYKELRELDRLIRAMDAADEEKEASSRGRRGDQPFDASAI